MRSVGSDLEPEQVQVDFILLRLFLAGAEPFTVRVDATARPPQGPCRVPRGVQGARRLRSRAMFFVARLITCV